ncbi:MAG: ABC transporter substrate-binding protein [Acidimicrobiales bacterium]
MHSTRSKGAAVVMLCALIVAACGGRDIVAFDTATVRGALRTVVTAPPQEGGLLPPAPADGTSDGSGGSGIRPSGGKLDGAGGAREPIRLGTILPLQGGERDLGEPVLRTTQAFIDELNLRGGVRGHPLELIAYSACILCQSEALTAARRLVEEDKVFAFVNTYLMVVPFQSVLPYLVDKGVPVIQGGSFDQTDDALSPVNFATAPSGLFFGRLIPETLKRHTSSRAVGITYLDVPSETSGLPILRKELARVGIRVAAEERVQAAEDAVTNMDAVMTRMRAAGADGIIALDPAVLIFGRLAARRQGFNVPMVGPAAWSTLVEDGCGATCDDLIVTDTAGLSYIDRDSPQMHQFLDVMANRYPGGQLTGHTLAAWVGMQLTTHVLNQTGPDRRQFLAAMEAIRNLDLGTTSPLTFTPDRHLGGSRTTLLKLKGGKYYAFERSVDYGLAEP